MRYIKHIIIGYEIIDIILFVVSVVIPFIFVDLIEIFVGLFLDAFIFFYLYDDEDIGVYAIPLFMLEALVILDLLFWGTEVLGWIALIPFWYIGYNYLKDDDIDQISSQKKDISNSIIKEIHCPACNEIITPDQIYCESCGVQLTTF